MRGHAGHLMSYAHAYQWAFFKQILLHSTSFCGTSWRSVMRTSSTWTIWRSRTLFCLTRRSLTRTTTTSSESSVACLSTPFCILILHSHNTLSISIPHTTNNIARLVILVPKKKNYDKKILSVIVCREAAQPRPPPPLVCLRVSTVFLCCLWYSTPS